MAVAPASRRDPEARGMPSPLCACAVSLSLTKASRAYPGSGGAVLCNACDERAHGDTLVYHCEMGKCSAHRGGYDLCGKCGFKQVTHQTRAPMCTCGTGCIQIEASLAYADHIHIYCDKCMRRCYGSTTVWHCPKGKGTAHTGGYDICGECALTSALAVDCPCGSRMTVEHFSRLYSGHGMVCDQCGERVMRSSAEAYAFHCPRERIPVHSGGFDLCLSCAYKESLTKLLRIRGTVAPSTASSVPGTSASVATSAAVAVSAITLEVPTSVSGDGYVGIRLALRSLGLFDKHWPTFEEQEIDDSTLEYLTNEEIDKLFKGKMGPKIKFNKWLAAFKKKKKDVDTAAASDSSSAMTVLCSICLDAVVDHSCVPCGHLCVCGGCSKYIKADRKCPICRTIAMDVVKIYVSGHSDDS